jgi:chromosome segregation ATPase
LKSENLKLEEKGSSGFLSTTEPFTSVPKVTSAALLSAEEGLVEVNLHDEYDGPSWTEGMSVQNQEIKRLEEEVAYLKDQCDRWRRQAEGEEKEDAEKLQVIFPVISEQEEIATLKDEIENLNGNLLEERDSHKHQIATLQDQHKDSLQSLQKIHRQELDKLQMVIQGLKQDLEEANQKLALKESKSDSQEKLATEKQNLQSEITSLEERMEKEKSQKEELTANLTSLRGETEALSQHVNALSQQLAEKSAETDLLKLEYTASEERFRDLTSQLAALKTSNTELEQHNKLLLRDLQAANSSTRSLSEREQRNLHELASAMVKLKSDLPIAKKTVRITLSAMSEGISKSFASLTTAIRSHLEREGERARAIADQLRSVEEQYTQVSQELEEVRRSGVEQPSGWDDEGWNTSGTQVSDLEEKIRELEKQVHLEISSKERLKEHLTRISADHDAELSELVEERDRLQASVCEFEKMNSSQTKDDSFWQSSEGGWDDWSSEGRGAQWTPEEDKVDMSQDQVASEKWKKYGEPVLEALSKTLGNFSEPTHEDIDNMVAILRERGALQSQLKEVERSLDQSRDEVALKEQLLEQTTQQLQTNREAYTNVETEKEDLKKETAKLQAELDDSRRRFKEVRVQLLEKTRECTEHSEEKGRMEVQLGESLRVKEGLMSSTAAERLQAQQDHQQLLLDVEEKTSSLANLQAVVSEKDIELAKMQEERMEFEEQQSQLMQVFAEANQKLREKDLETTSLQKQLENVREEASQLQVNQEARDKLEEEVTSLRGLLHQAESKVEVHKQEAMKLEGKISELLQLLQVKEEEMVLLSRENTKKEEVLRGVTKEENKMSSQLNERVLVLEGALQQARTELTNIESQHMATVSALEESLAKTASENRNKDVDVSELREELKKTVEERKKLETDFINLRAQNQLLSQKASELEAEIIRLKGVIATGQDAKDSSLKVLEAQLTAVSAERDQVLSTLGEIGKENGLLKEELATMKDAHQQSAQKNSEDVQRLKRHLLQVDEHYTQEAVKAEEREIELRQKLSTLEEEMSRTTLSEQASIHQRDQEVVSLQQQLHVLAQQRDDAVIKLSTTQDEVEQTQHELSNLQMVLEQFQKDHTAEVNAALQLSRVELLKAETDKEGMRHEIDQLKGQLREASFSLENASHLEHELELREKQYEELQQKVKELQDNLGASQLQITQLTSQDEDKVDKCV